MPDLSHLTADQKAELRYRLELRQQYKASSEEDRKRIEHRAKLESDFGSFVREAWSILEPGNKLVWSWHYDLIAEYMLLAAEKKCKRLIINIPPRTLKSILITIMFPVWVWTRSANQSFACASYGQTLSEELSVKRRRLLESEWFQRIWGDKIHLQKDQNQKSKFQNNFQAQMFATSVGATMQGIGGQFLIADDVLKADDILSDARILELQGWFDKTWRQRLNDPSTDVMIIVEQRTGELDITGYCLDGDKLLTDKGEAPEWTHLCIPLEADEEAIDKKTQVQRFVFPISGRVKDRPLGDVLQPERFTPAVVAAKKVRRLTWATQEQGRPSPLEGNMIKRSEVMYYGGRDPATGELDPRLPDKFDMIVISADCAFKDEKHSDYVAIGTVGVKGPKRYILEVVNKHLDEPATETEILRHRDKYKAQVVLVEDKANGPAVIKQLKRKIPGVIAIEPEGGKMSRFYASCGEWQSLDWYVDRNAGWTDAFVDQVTKFPAAKNDDMADMMTQACIYLQKQNYVFGLTEYFKNEAEMEKKKLIAKVQATTDVAKVDNPDFIKPDVDDSTERCPEEGCGSTFIQRIPNGRRCGACGYIFPRVLGQASKTTDFGILRK